MMKRYLVLILSIFFCSPIHAEDLKTLYQLAVEEDPTLQAAFSAMQANKQSLPKAIARMVPNLSANYSTTGNETIQSQRNAFVTNGSFNTKSYSLNLAQPIFHPEHWATLEQSRHIVKASEATYLSAAQALIVRVSEEYFNTLSAIDDLDFAKGERKAFAREYEQAKQRFEVGLIAITDVETAKARYDNAVAREISAQNTVADQYELLRRIVGQPVTEVTLFPLSKPLKLLPPTPKNQEQWVASSHEYNLDVIAAKENAQQLKAAIGIQAANHFPIVDVNGQLARNKTNPPFQDLVYNKSITLNIAIPLFAGGGVIYATKEASARYQESLENLEFAHRLADGTTRTAYRGVLTAISSVEALAQAVISNQSALKATKAAYEVGTRTIVDVLNAESALLNAIREHSQARYNYLLQGLRLKQAAGTLTSEDLFCLNEILEGKATA